MCQCEECDSYTASKPSSPNACLFLFLFFWGEVLFKCFFRSSGFLFVLLSESLFSFSLRFNPPLSSEVVVVESESPGSSRVWTYLT